MEVKIYSPAQFDDLESAWRVLEDGSEMTAFQSYDWFKNINNLYFRERIKKAVRRWIYLLVTDCDKPIMIAPIQIVKFGKGFHCNTIGLNRGAYFIGRQGYTDYLNFIYFEFCEKAANFIFDYLKNEYHIKRFCFEQLLNETSLYQYIINNFTYTQSTCYCATLTLPKTFDEYKSRLSKSTRQNIRTALNRQRKNNLCLTHEIVYDFDEELLNTLMSIRDQRLGDKKKSAYKSASFLGGIYLRLHDAMRYCVDGKQDVIRENCNPWAFLVKNEDRIVGYYWGIHNSKKGEFYVILAGVDKEYAWYSPSLSHLYLYIQEQYESNDHTVKVFDFTRGGERYKTDIGGEKRDAWTINFQITT